ncbi:MAG: substrate-binding domain-containing protein [bacterium]
MTGIARLAKELGISTGTVSRALNDKPDVNPETRRRVLETARRFGYVANQSARNLAKGKTNAIGFMIELHSISATHSDNFFMGVCDGMQSLLHQQGLDLLLLPCPSTDDPFPYLQRFVARGAVDALVISGTQRVDPRIDFLQDRGIPFVALGRSSSGRDYSWIDLDFEGVADAAIDRFVAHGHRRIAAALPLSDINYNTVFIEAYRKALARHGLPFDPQLLIREVWSEQGGYEATCKMLALDDRPTAVLVIFELMVLGMYRRLAEVGVLPGRDIAVASLRDDPASRFLSPRVTSFQLSLHDLGVGVAEAILAQMPEYAEAFPLGIVQKRWPMRMQLRESDSFILP